MILKGVVTTSTCSSVISTNTTYIRNPGYPSSYTPSSAGTCSYTINKVNTAWNNIISIWAFNLFQPSLFMSTDVPIYEILRHLGRAVRIK